MRQSDIAAAATQPPRPTGHEGTGGKPVPSTEQGQTLVEFALSITITLMLIFGLIDFSRAVYTASVVQWAAQEGARAGTVDLNQVESAALARLVGLDVSEVEVIQSPPDSNNVIIVEVVYPFRFITPIIEPFAPEGIPMQGAASMLIR